MTQCKRTLLLHIMLLSWRHCQCCQPTCLRQSTCPLRCPFAAVLRNTCRAEAANTLKSKLEAVFGPSLDIGGLGGVLTCGVTGLQAGMSRAARPSVRLHLACIGLFTLLVAQSQGYCAIATLCCAGVLLSFMLLLVRHAYTRHGKSLLFPSHMDQDTRFACQLKPVRHVQTQPTARRRLIVRSSTSSFRFRTSASTLPAAPVQSAARGKRARRRAAMRSTRLSLTSSGRG